MLNTFGVDIIILDLDTVQAILKSNIDLSYVVVITLELINVDTDNELILDLNL